MNFIIGHTRQMEYGSPDIKMIVECRPSHIDRVAGFSTHNILCVNDFAETIKRKEIERRDLYGKALDIFKKTTRYRISFLSSGTLIGDQGPGTERDETAPRSVLALHEITAARPLYEGNSIIVIIRSMPHHAEKVEGFALAEEQADWIIDRSKWLEGKKFKDSKISTKSMSWRKSYFKLSEPIMRNDKPTHVSLAEGLSFARVEREKGEFTFPDFPRTPTEDAHFDGEGKFE